MAGRSPLWPVATPPSKESRPIFSEDGEIIAVPGVVNYVDESTKEVHVTRLPNGDDDGPTTKWVKKEVMVQNGRNRPFQIHKNGFEIVYNKVSDMNIDFLDTADVIDRYYPHCEAFMKEKLGGNVLVKAFDHNIRVNEGGIEDRNLKNGKGSRAQTPLAVVHGDYTKVSGPRRLENLALPPKANDVMRLKLKEGETLLDPALVKEVLEGKKRFAIINVWRSIDPENPVQESPLACIDSASTSIVFSDCRTLFLHYTDREGENYLVVPQDRHSWTFFPDMEINDCLLLKQWDSKGDIANGEDYDEETSTFTIHSAIQTSLHEDPAPRKSIEVRLVCIWDE